ncbi:MAG TPA: YkgJ family cysteine cluster protein [Phycisphaerales bacterium]|nr:YkgJ family cysteine cluster protein [Phycisphaerales bacterium]
MEVDAKNVRLSAEQADDENFEFRRFLKWQDKLSDEQLDELVWETTRHIWADFDCTTCGNCRRELVPTVTAEEIERLAARLDVSVEEFHERYVECVATPDEDDVDPDGPSQWRLQGRPCPFLNGNRCTVYEDRPTQCREYPYLYEPRFAYRLMAMLERTYTCPVVYQVLEALKRELPFRRRGQGHY